MCRSHRRRCNGVRIGFLRLMVPLRRAAPRFPAPSSSTDTADGAIPLPEIVPASLWLHPSGIAAAHVMTHNDWPDLFPSLCLEEINSGDALPDPSIRAILTRWWQAPWLVRGQITTRQSGRECIRRP
jgi:hypothetical protein